MDSPFSLCFRLVKAADIKIIRNNTCVLRPRELLSKLNPFTPKPFKTYILRPNVPKGKVQVSGSESW